MPNCGVAIFSVTNPVIFFALRKIEEARFLNNNTNENDESSIISLYSPPFCILQVFNQVLRTIRQDKTQVRLNQECGSPQKRLIVHSSGEKHTRTSTTPYYFVPVQRIFSLFPRVKRRPLSFVSFREVALGLREIIGRSSCIYLLPPGPAALRPVSSASLAVDLDQN